MPFFRFNDYKNVLLNSFLICLYPSMPKVYIYILQILY